LIVEAAGNRAAAYDLRQWIPSGYFVEGFNASYNPLESLRMEQRQNPQ
jgi:hypothetical protein